jgi:hypothetical protein
MRNEIEGMTVEELAVVETFCKLELKRDATEQLVKEWERKPRNPTVDDYLKILRNELAETMNLLALLPAPATEEQTAFARIVDKTEQQDDAILKWLIENNYDPLKLPKGEQGKAGIRKLCGDAVCKTYKLSQPVFKTAWDRLRAAEKTMVKK